MLILCSSETDIPAEEKSFKRSAISLSAPSSGKMIFALLAKVVAVIVWLPKIQVWEPSLELTFLGAILVASGLWTVSLCLETRIHAELCNSLEIFLGIPDFFRVGSKRSFWRWSIQKKSIQEAAREGGFGGPMSLGAGVPNLELLLGPVERGGFLRQGAIAVERGDYRAGWLRSFSK